MEREVSLETALSIENSIVMTRAGDESFNVVRCLAVEPGRGIRAGDSHEGMVFADPCAGV